MRIVVVLLASGLTLGALGARAADFTGVYAGMNAGYAFGHEKDKTTGSVAIPGSDAAGIDRSLPPSAARASRAMQDAGSRPSRSTR